VSLTIEKEPVKTFMVSEKMLYQFRNGVLTECQAKPSYEEAVKYVLYELEKMGAHVEVLNAHEALIIGPTPLRGRTVASNDIRAGAAMVIAALCAEGETAITDIRYIERGYDRLDEKLRSLGAKIQKIETSGQEE
ncbi:MAG: UDP-N-acetylglucosamine 1-carboxyvinyltransferase, partial [Candidatus Peribacteria bacterium GW2011_GWB1_54_5]